VPHILTVSSNLRLISIPGPIPGKWGKNIVDAV